MKTNAPAPTMTDAAVKAKTGKTWTEWFAVLDAAGAASMNHQQIVAVLVDGHMVGSWWQQMIAVNYEQSRGLRAKHQRPDGFQVGASKVLEASSGAVFEAWKDPAIREMWLGDHPIGLRLSTPGKSLRAAWLPDGTPIDVNLTAKGENRCQVSVQHGKLKDAEEAERMKQFWKDRLDRLAIFLAE